MPGYACQTAGFAACNELPVMYCLVALQLLYRIPSAASILSPHIGAPRRAMLGQRTVGRGAEERLSRVTMGLSPYKLLCVLHHLLHVYKYMYMTVMLELQRQC